MNDPEQSPASVPVSDGSESASNVGLADISEQIDRCDRREKIALSMALWQDGEMHLDGPDTLAHIAVEHLRDRGWHNPLMAQSMTHSFDRLWRAFWMVAVSFLCAFIALVWVVWTVPR